VLGGGVLCFWGRKKILLFFEGNRERKIGSHKKHFRVSPIVSNQIQIMGSLYQQQRCEGGGFEEVLLNPFGPGN